MFEIATIVSALLIYDFVKAAFATVVLRKQYPRDDTDPPGKWSGLAVRTDAATGVQYVFTLEGGLTPRIDEDGFPMTSHDFV
jgi:hypothetical protein